jgi:hypothetical protein
LPECEIFHKPFFQDFDCPVPDLKGAGLKKASADLDFDPFWALFGSPSLGRDSPINSLAAGTGTERRLSNGTAAA